MNIENGHGDSACADFAEALVLATDNELTTAEWRAVERHLGQCAACRLQWSAVARMEARLRECGAAINAQSPPDPAVRVRLVEAVRSRQRSRSDVGWLGQGRWGWVLASAASLCAAAIAAWIILVPENL
jgi:anti-sigma factor RsiW